MKNKGKTAKPNTKSHPATKNISPQTDKLRVIDEYIDTKTMQKKPATNRWMERFAEEMVQDIGANEEFRSVNQYLLWRGLNRRSYYDWIKKYDYLGEANDIALSILSERNSQRVHDDYKYIHFVQPHYDPYVYGKMAEYWANLKKLEHNDDKPTTINVIVDPVPDKIKGKGE